MRLPEACFKSKYKQAKRKNAFHVAYIATMYKLDNGGFEIKYERQLPNRLPTEVKDRSEVEGYDDWVTIETGETLPPPNHKE